LLLGLIIPVPAAFVFAVILRLVQVNFLIFSEVRMINMLLLGVAINIIVMRFYILKFKLADTAKGILISTLAVVLLFFLFLKNSNFVLPF
jgi:hypothetical protein